MLETSSCRPCLILGGATKPWSNRRVVRVLRLPLSPRKLCDSKTVRFAGAMPCHAIFVHSFCISRIIYSWNHTKLLSIVFPYSSQVRHLSSAGQWSVGAFKTGSLAVECRFPAPGQLHRRDGPAKATEQHSLMLAGWWLWLSDIFSLEVLWIGFELLWCYDLNYDIYRPPQARWIPSPADPSRPSSSSCDPELQLHSLAHRADFHLNPFILCLCIPLLSVAVCIVVIISFWIAPYQLTIALNNIKAYAWQPPAAQATTFGLWCGKMGPRFSVQTQGGLCWTEAGIMCTPCLYGSSLGLCWAQVVPMLGQVVLSHLGPILGLCWAKSGPCWAMLGPSWAYIGPGWAYVGLCWAHLGPMLGLCYAHVGLCRAYVGPCWAILGAMLWPCLGHLCWNDRKMPILPPRAPSRSPKPRKNRCFLTSPRWNPLPPKGPKHRKKRCFWMPRANYTVNYRDFSPWDGGSEPAEPNFWADAHRRLRRTTRSSISSQFGLERYSMKTCFRNIFLWCFRTYLLEIDGFFGSKWIPESSCEGFFLKKCDCCQFLTCYFV